MLDVQARPSKSVIAAVIGLAIAGFIFLTVLRSQPPEYEGRSLDAWLREAMAESPAAKEKAREALRAMRPSPGPILVRRLREENSLLRRFARLWPFHTHFAEHGMHGPEIYGLLALGPEAKPLIPDLAPLIWNENVGDGVILILSQLGPESAPVLMDALTNSPPLGAAGSLPPRFLAIRRSAVRRRIVMALGSMGTNAQAAAPTLLSDLKSPDRITRLTAQTALGRVGARNDPTIRRALLSQLNDPDATTRGQAARALAFGGAGFRETQRSRRADYNPLEESTNSEAPDPEVFAAVRKVAEHDPSDRARRMAVPAMIHLSAQEALDAFRSDLSSTNLETRRNGAWNLMYFKKGARAAVPALVAALSDSDGTVRLNAAVALREIGEEPQLVVPALVKHLDDPDPQVRPVSAVALGAFGEAAKPAVPKILEILKTAGEFESEGIMAALYKIDPATVERLQQENSK